MQKKIEQILRELRNLDLFGLTDKQLQSLKDGLFDVQMVLNYEEQRRDDPELGEWDPKHQLWRNPDDA